LTNFPREAGLASHQDSDSCAGNAVPAPRRRNSALHRSANARFFLRAHARGRIELSCSRFRNATAQVDGLGEQPFL